MGDFNGQSNDTQYNQHDQDKILNSIPHESQKGFHWFLCDCIGSEYFSSVFYFLASDPSFGRRTQQESRQQCYCSVNMHIHLVLFLAVLFIWPLGFILLQFCNDINSFAHKFLIYGRSFNVIPVFHNVGTTVHALFQKFDQGVVISVFGKRREVIRKHEKSFVNFCILLRSAALAMMRTIWESIRGILDNICLLFINTVSN
mmetsp:Transcript_639/g.1452  ORF Transcript_639/g.1452 Transcript_639/m.1452 type:complete len:201 (+) Transcript_639:3024-3626(+)